MALVKTGPIVTAISGQVGGVQFSNTKRGTIAGKIPARQNNDTNKHVQAKLIFARLSQHWTSLTFLQKSPWNNLAAIAVKPDRLGQARHPSGRSLWITFQTQFAKHSTTPTTQVPIANVPPWNFVPEWTLDASHLTLEFDFPGTHYNLIVAPFVQRHWSAKQLKRFAWTALPYGTMSTVVPHEEFFTKMSNSVGMPDKGELLSIRLLWIYFAPYYALVQENIQTISY